MKKSFLFSFAALILFAPCAWATDELKTYLKAHGGLSEWQSNAAVEFDLEGWPFSSKSKLADHHLINLKSSRALITSSDYRIGHDGRTVWAYPNLDAAGLAAGIYLGSSSFFFNMPFSLEDGDRKIQELGERFLGNEVLETYRSTPKKIAADGSSDDFVAYFSTSTHLLRLLHFPIKEGGRQAAVFEWQDADDFFVPERITFYTWQGDGLGTLIGSARIRHVRFRSMSPAPELFGRPGGSQIDQ